MKNKMSFSITNIKKNSVFPLSNVKVQTTRVENYSSRYLHDYESMKAKRINISCISQRRYSEITIRIFRISEK